MAKLYNKLEPIKKDLKDGRIDVDTAVEKLLEISKEIKMTGKERRAFEKFVRDNIPQNHPSSDATNLFLVIS